MPESGCWIWTGAIDDSGYARISYQKINKPAHRVSYTIFVGEIPQGLEIDHKCKVRCCVNPNHLEAVTKQENQRRCDNELKGSYNRAKTHCIKGHEYSEDNIYIHRSFKYGKLQHARICKTCHNDNRKARRVS